MGRIGIEDIRGGMILRADAVAPGNRRLLEAGTELTDSHLRLLSMWGITEVDVEGTSRADVVREALATLEPDERAAVERRADALFRHNDSAYPAIAELRQFATLRLIRSRR